MHDPIEITRRTAIAGAAAAAALALTATAQADEPAAIPARKRRPARMPTAFVGHGSPLLALDKARGDELARWARAMPKPVAILCVSAHFERRPITIGATTSRPLVYDFRGFPKRLYELKYAAPGAPRLARRVRAMLTAPGALPSRGIRTDPRRGHDHGTWVPLRWMYPDADVPVLSVSLPSHDPKTLWRLGRALRPLRDEGVLILGSGMLTHNLRYRAPRGAKSPTWSTAFDAWARETLDKHDVDALLDWERKAPAARTNHPTVEHFVPLILATGARHDADVVSYPITGFSGGMSRRAVMLASRRSK